MPPPTNRIGPYAAEALARGGNGTVATARPGVAFVQMGGGPVLALLPSGTPIHPWAMTVSIDLSSIPQGARVRVGQGVLAVGATLIPLGATKPVRLSLPSRPWDLPERAMRHLLGLSLPPREKSPFGPAAVKSLADFRAGGTTERLTRLLGMGKGLTPSGDDILVGVLAGLDLLQRASERAAENREELVAYLLPQLETDTSQFSGAMIAAAAAGSYAEPVLTLLREVGRRNATAASLEAACAPLLDVGHDSGISMLEGIRAAFARSLRFRQPGPAGPDF